MLSRFVIHLHRTGRTHYDLRLLEGERLRSWSMLREPPLGQGQGRLAIERESFQPEAIEAIFFAEEAFGSGKVRVWDSGQVEVVPRTDDEIALDFAGKKIAGRYRLSRTRWYPGNRWILRKAPEAGPRSSGGG